MKRQSTMHRIVLAALISTAYMSVACAGTCEEAMAAYTKQVAEDNAADTSDWAPGVKEANAKITARMKANIAKGCAPGGLYGQLDKAIEEVKAECKAHSDKKGC
jgi:hypothetical protein